MGGSRLRRAEQRNYGSCEQWVNGLGLLEPHARTIGACSLYSAAQVMDGMPGLGGWIWLGSGSDGAFGRVPRLDPRCWGVEGPDAIQADG